MTTKDEEFSQIFSRLSIRHETEQATNKSLLVPKTGPDTAHIWEDDVWKFCQIGHSFQVKDYLQDVDEEKRSRLVNGRDGHGNTALILASGATHMHGGCEEVIKTLLKYGAQTNAQNCHGRTALMEASLWGGLKAVEALLGTSQKPEADVTLRDDRGFTAIDLAGLGEEQRSERRKRCSSSEHKENPRVDDLQRKEIVKLLQARHDHYTNIESMKTELKQTRQENQKLSREMGGLKFKLQLKQAMSDEEMDKLDQKETANAEIQKKLDSAQDFIKALYLPRPDDNVRFLDVKSVDGTLDTYVNLIETFRFGPKEDYYSKKLEYRKMTIACLGPNDLLDGHYRAKNGKSEDPGFISGKIYVEEAKNLFTKLGSRRPESYFQHAEPQLMAFYMEQYYKEHDLSLEVFTNAPDQHGPSNHGELYKVKILASRAPCGACREMMGLINKPSKRYGFEFSLECALVDV